MVLNFRIDVQTNLLLYILNIFLIQIHGLGQNYGLFSKIQSVDPSGMEAKGSYGLDRTHKLLLKPFINI